MPKTSESPRSVADLLEFMPERMDGAFAFERPGEESRTLGARLVSSIFVYYTCDEYAV